MKPSSSTRRLSGSAWWCIRGAVTASGSDIRWSITFEITWYTIVMIRGPPGVPVTMKSCPAESSTMVGVIAESIRLPGAIALASPCTRPYMFGLPGAVAKSSISSLSRKPAPVTVTALP